MRNNNSIIAILLSLVMALTMSPVYASAGDNAGEADSAPEMQFESGQILVVTEKGTSKKELNEIAAEAEGEIDTVSVMGDGTGIALIEVDEGRETAAAAELKTEDNVLLAQPNYIYEFDSYPDDPDYTDSMQRYLSEDPLTGEENAGSINAAGAWSQLREKYPLGTERVLVGVIDSGVRLDHEDLQECVLKDECVSYIDGKKMAFDAIDDSDDDNGHGTSVTGIIGADINNGKGVAGIAGGRTDIFVVDASQPGGGVRSIDIAMGIYYAADKGARLINLSLGGASRDILVDRAIKYAWDNNALCICAAGNSGSSFIHYPGDSLYAVNVMAHDLSGKPASFTCYGIEKDISAPGNDLYSTAYFRRTSYGSFTGTSAAAPVVTGAAALLLAAKPDLTPREIKNLLYTSTGKEAFSAEKEGQGFGRLNIDTAIRNLLADKVAPEKIVINRSSLDMYEGEDSSIEYAVYPGNTDSVSASFSSSNESIVTVDDNGIVKAVSPGNAEILVSCKGASAVCRITVRETPYVTIDRKPYSTAASFTMDDLMDYSQVTDDSGQIVNEDGFFYHQYRIDLEKGETVSAYMYSNDCKSRLRIKDRDGSIVAKDDRGNDVDYSLVRYLLILE